MSFHWTIIPFCFHLQFSCYTKFTLILAPIRCNAIIVFTALIQRFLITYRFSFAFVTDNSVFKAELMSQGCFNASWPDRRLLQLKNDLEKVKFLEFRSQLEIRDVYTYLGSSCNNLRIKSFAVFETILKASSSKLYFPNVTFVIVSISVSPWNGDNPDSNT